MKCGGVVTTTDRTVTTEDLKQQILETEASIIVADEEVLDKVLPIAQKHNVKTIFCVKSPWSNRKLPKGVIDFQKVMVGCVSETKDLEYSSTDIAVVTYSAAANGLLVGRMLTHENISTAADIYEKFLQRMMRKELNYANISEERLLYCSSLANMFGLLCMDVALIMGFTSPCLLITEPKNIVATLKQPISEDFKVSSLEYVLCSGPVLGKGARNEFLQMFPSVQYMADGAGMIDGAPAALIPNVEDKKNGNCVVPTCETKLVCARREVEADEMGEIFLRGPTVMQGYIDDGEPIDANGWFHTGEVGHFDQQGNIFVDGRLDDFIDVCGNQYCPLSLLLFIVNVSVVIILDRGVKVEKGSSPIGVNKAGGLPN
ncbi:unnamed protein product [Strongylus vulgaris]|uniref:AMP-dependent synthetase/ligase domain-containing protein n=1 Tax=Strongylus vulgaris TaxID=40348 RepID=A0A3P7IJ25_STRVU|nr:unnamed protein product [Strongylus vulgaris]